MDTYEAWVHYTDEAGVECEATTRVGAWDSERAWVLVMDWATRHGIAWPVVVSLEVVA